MAMHEVPDTDSSSSVQPLIACHEMNYSPGNGSPIPVSTAVDDLPISISR
jgi:hypothetical protein